MSWIGLHPIPTESPHCTVLWWEDAADNDLVVDVVAPWAGKTPPFAIPTIGTDNFGKGKDIPVVLLDPAQEYLAEFRRLLEDFSSSEYGWNPHVTYGYEGIFPVQWVSMNTPAEIAYLRLMG